MQRVTKYPLLLSRLLKVTPAHHEDRGALQESRERIEHHLENMNQEARDTNSTRLWRRISMINVSSYRKMDSQLDVLGNTTWGIRKVNIYIYIYWVYYYFGREKLFVKRLVLRYIFIYEKQTFCNPKYIFKIKWLEKDLCFKKLVIVKLCLSLLTNYFSLILE